MATWDLSRILCLVKFDGKNRYNSGTGRIIFRLKWTRMCPTHTEGERVTEVGPFYWLAQSNPSSPPPPALPNPTRPVTSLPNWRKTGENFWGFFKISIRNVFPGEIFKTYKCSNINLICFYLFFPSLGARPSTCWITSVSSWMCWKRITLVFVTSITTSKGNGSISPNQWPIKSEVSEFFWLIFLKDWNEF
jgi:hypothetical protein